MSPPPHRIELNLRDIGQFFNTMDPSPFHEKDIDHDAEEFILNWANEFALDDPLVLVVHLGEFPPGPHPQATIEQAMRHYFAHAAEMNRLEFRRLMAEGRRCVLIGLLFLGLCLFAGEALAKLSQRTMAGVLRESLTIGGWVAMWRPMEIYLYDWWPLRRMGKILEKLSRMPVEVRRREPRDGEFQNP